MGSWKTEDDIDFTVTQEHVLSAVKGSLLMCVMAVALPFDAKISMADNGDIVVDWQVRNINTGVIYVHHGIVAPYEIAVRLLSINDINDSRKRKSILMSTVGELGTGLIITNHESKRQTPPNKRRDASAYRKGYNFALGKGNAGSYTNADSWRNYYQGFDAGMRRIKKEINGTYVRPSRPPRRATRRKVGTRIQRGTA